MIKLIASLLLLLLGWFSASSFMSLNFIAHNLTTLWAIPVYILMGWVAIVTALIVGSAVGVWFVKLD